MTVREMKSPVVASKVTRKLTMPASRDRTGPFGIFSFSGSPLIVSMKLTVPSPLSIGPVSVNC
jgi:hypothetical protein